MANNDYRYGYQGQYAEIAKETGWNNFDFRMYDAQIGRWMSTDPMGQYASPYLGMGNNPLNRVDPDGGEDGPKPRPVVNWKDFKTSEMVVHLNDVNIHKFTPRETVSAKEFNFWDRVASSNDISVKFTYDLIDAPYVWFTQAFSMDKGARNLDQTPATYNDRMSAGISTMLMATGPVSRAYSGMTSYTKSTLQLGLAKHKAYKVGADGINEFRLPSGKRIDFLDINNSTIYELKPFNPRAMEAGKKQLNIYMKELQTMKQFKGVNWKTVLDTY